MPVKVNLEKCNSCSMCVEICPVDVLRLDGEGRPYMKYDECWYCGCCEEECPTAALKIILPYLIT